MIQIRQGVFETNSSSTHSIVVQKKRAPVVRPRSDHGEFAVYDGETLTLTSENYFGWGWGVLTSWLDRFAYTMAEFGSIPSSAKEILSKVKERLGCKIEYGECSRWWSDNKMIPDFGDIDHQSKGILFRFLSEEGIDPVDFIFDDKYIVIIDNDNNDMDAYNAFIAKLEVQKEFNNWM